MRNWLLFKQALLIGMFCFVTTDGDTTGGMCYAQASIAQWSGGQLEGVRIEELAQEPFEPLYVYVGPDKLREAIEAYKESLKDYDKEESPREYSVLQIRLGSSYLALQTVQREKDIRSAAEHFDEAMKVCGAKGIEREYYEAKIGLGLVLTELSDGDAVGNLRQAVNMLSEGAKFFAREESSRAYIVANNGLGFAHVHLYNMAGQKKEDASAAEGHFKKVLSTTSYERLPAEYARARLGLGTLYATLVDVDGKSPEDKALHELWDARNIFSEEFFPTFYTNNLFLTGLVYAGKGDYEKAEEFIEKTLEVAGRTNDPHLQRYMSYFYALQARRESDEL